MQKTQTTLFEQVGGMQAVTAAVKIFYKKVTSDELVKGFFEHIDIEKQAGKLTAFLAFAIGAPLSYDGKSMREAHAGMNITEEHFAAVGMHLEDTLVELNLSNDIIEEVMELVGTTMDDVLNR